MKKFFFKWIPVFLSLSLASCFKDTVIVPSYETEEIEVSDLNSLFHAFYSDGDTLPLKDKEGNVLCYSVKEGNITIEDGILSKNEEAAEYESVILEVSNGKETETIQNITVLDPIVAYVISYFTSSGNDAEQLKLAYTYNCTYWFELGNDSGILKPSCGTKRLRDPSFVRTKDGTFVLLATEGYDNPTIYAFDTNDMITYTNERRLRVNVSTDSLALSESQAWAPEGTYMRSEDRYYIYWSSKTDGGMFYNTTADFESISYPLGMLEVGQSIIDGTFYETENGYTWIYKDEEEPMATRSQLYRTHTDTLNGTPGTSDRIDAQHQLEGPMIMKSLEKEGWFVFADCYTFGKYKILYTDDIESGSFEEYQNTEEIMLPMEAPAHASAIGVTWKELERLMAAYE